MYTHDGDYIADDFSNVTKEIAKKYMKFPDDVEEDLGYYLQDAIRRHFPPEEANKWCPTLDAYVDFILERD